jgi:hypothetical protein
MNYRKFMIVRLDSYRRARRLPQAMAALRELTGADPAARRALSAGLARGARQGLTGAALLVSGFLAMERWRQAQRA